MTGADRSFVRRALARRRLYLPLAAAGVAVAAGLSAYYAWRRLHDPGFPLGARVALVVLILLNARQNLRQHRYARVLAELAAQEQVDQPPPGYP